MTRVVAIVRRRLLPDGQHRDAGQVTAFAVVMILALLAVAGLVLDAGLALSVKLQALDTAQAAARAGAQQLDLARYRTTGVAAALDPVQATASAHAWLTAAGIDGQATATADTVTVTVHRASRTQLLGLLGITELHVTATATATAVQGTTGPGT